jgi:hypothetical protein
MIRRCYDVSILHHTHMPMHPISCAYTCRILITNNKLIISLTDVAEFSYNYDRFAKEWWNSGWVDDTDNDDRIVMHRWVKHTLTYMWRVMMHDTHMICVHNTAASLDMCVFRCFYCTIADPYIVNAEWDSCGVISGAPLHWWPCWSVWWAAGGLQHGEGTMLMHPRSIHLIWQWRCTIVRYIYL